MFIHTADWHIGKPLKDVTDSLSRQIEAVTVILDYANKSEYCNAVLVAADVFDDYEPPQHVKDAFLDVVLTYDRKMNCPVYIMEGNHSTAHDYSNLKTFVTLYNFKKLKWFKFITTPKLMVNEAMAISIVPHGFNYNTVPRKHAAKVKRIGKPWVVMLHDLLHGSTLESGKVVENKQSGKLIQVPGVRYYACGDVHKAGRVAGKANAWYCGSPIQHTFGEHLPKGFLLVNEQEKYPKPRLIKEPLDHIKKLVTITDIQQAPTAEEAYVKYKRVDDSDVSEQIPDNVITVEDVILEQETVNDEGAAADVIKSIDREKELFLFLKRQKGYSSRKLTLAKRLVGDLFTNAV